MGIIYKVQNIKPVKYKIQYHRRKKIYDIYKSEIKNKHK
jgi:hypothetical protein